MKAKALIDVHDVIVDGFGDANNSNAKSSVGDLLCNRQSSAQSAIASHDEQHVDPHSLQAVNNFSGILLTSRSSQHGPAFFINVADEIRGQLNDGMAVASDETLIAIAKSRDLSDAITKRQFHHESADDVIEAWAESSAGDNSCVSF